MRKIPVFLLFLVLFLISFSVLTQNDDFTPPSAIDYAPNFWFDSEEKYYPVNPLDFYFENGIEIIGEIAVDKYNQLSFEEKLNQITVFYHIKDEGNQWVYQYWFFYAFNDFPKLIKNKHYGDWESVFVFVDKDSNKVIKVIGTAHQRKLFDTEIYAPGINHIWTYIGNGSHANCIDEEDDGYCDFFKWRKWEKWDKNGPKISYSDYRLQEINLDFINGFEGAITLENSSKLGINIFDFFKTSEKEFYISLGGKPPIHAWEQESFYNPEVLRPISWKYLVEKVDQIKDKIIGFFKKIEPDQQQAAISSSLYTPLEHILTSIVSETIEEELNEQEIEPIIPELIPDKEIKEELKIEDKEIEEAEESQSIAQPTPPMGFPFFIGGSGAPPIEESIELEPEPEPEPLPAETPSGAEESEPEPEIDTIPPLAIVDLSVSSGDSRGTINLSWTSPGADQYIIKYATSSEITSLNWASSTDIVGELTPSLASTTENLTISNLTLGQTYYWAIKSKDGTDNVSEISNCAFISILATAENLIISEIAVQGSNGASDEFIEIYNPTDSPINLSGWSLQYALAQATTTWQYKYFWIDDSSSRDLPDFNLASHQYFLLTSATSSNYYSYGMQPDLAAVTTAGNPTYLGLSDTGGKIRLLNNNEEIIDLVAWGEDSLGAEGNPVGIDNFFWGSLERQAFASSTAELLAVNGAHHWSGNSIDRDDNSQDFVLQTVPNPQNSLSLVEPDAIFPELANTAWPMLQGDIQHSGLSAYVGTATGTPTSSPKWIVDLG
ncbi:MAG: lamin tail domain-containing protein, partial [Candidatus Portnoybacteria bacterium]|nr:lamin tail domain-containing protein [Candidatus Portnoybacteria bacterium]